MDGIKSVFTEKSLRLLVGNNQYTSNVESGSTRTEIKHWVELFFGVKVIAMNSHRLPGKGRRIGHTRHYRRMIITLQPGYYIPHFFFAEIEIEIKELQSHY
uniref:ribosomal protein L23 n=1 Tax=Corydalis platycarpa TaxID=2975469 RepID=UPI00226C7D12|nr:ribosomal protein L23 [Corydalis platycarpa]YP_010575552.1 ribosomal protein L23 [Corydalis platycarpa]UZM11210.1 ribosomal protein L23 [Corydalis platycarpa]UZM11211.1 ribosomal protein L23 [Corydalis platycarpa]